MNITLSVDEKIVIEARKVAASMGKSLNLIIREDLEQLRNAQTKPENALGGCPGIEDLMRESYFESDFFIT